ncbi:MAG TPA: TonB-dependent receptor [Gemmatimonadota bacterium]|nr:TonB-dependent receptor [Gemmatimonadota bacterium]
MDEFPSSLIRSITLAWLAAAAMRTGGATTVVAQEQPGTAAIVGRVLDAATGAPIEAALVRVEGLERSTLTDETGAYLLRGILPGPRVLRAEHLGYESARVQLTVPAGGTVRQDIRIGRTALELEGITVTADVAGRARGELGTASVVEEQAIRHQTAASLAGILELTPGIGMRPPGLDGVQQVSLRAVTTSTGGLAQLGPSAEQLASFGTLIIVDGVPVSNNANLQSLGAGGEFFLSTAAGGGIDLRQIPAETIERVEVIRGVPSARWGDLTQGAIVVETRAGAVTPEVGARYDGRTVEFTTLGGSELWGEQVFTASLNAARTTLAPGLAEDDAYRIAGRLAHRFAPGGGAGRPAEDAPFVLDTRLDYYQLHEDRPENPDVVRGRASSNRDWGLRLSERARIRWSERSRLELTLSANRQRQDSYFQFLGIRAAMPFTDRLTEGRAIGRFIGGEYLARAWLDGVPWLLFGRGEATLERGWLGLPHTIRTGLELRREWNDGPGYQFDIEFPPQVSFTSVEGFDRPRRYDAVPPLATSALYVDDRVAIPFGERGIFSAQAGLRLDVLHDGTHWASGARDALLQPRVNIELMPWPWVRLRGGWGRTAKTPTLDQLSPAPQYYDVVNVNWYANAPEERLALLTTFIRDPSNPDLGFSVGDKAEAGIELALGAAGGALSLVAFRDRVHRGVGVRPEPSFLEREHFALADSTQGTGEPPEIIEPATHADSVPILIHRRANNLELENRGLELTATLPEIPVLRTRFEVQGSLVETSLAQDALDFGLNFSSFQVSENLERAPFWEGGTRTGTLALLIYRIIHHQPAVGLVITGAVQHTVHETRRDVGASDTLAFSGYITRDGTLVPVPPEDRGLDEYRDLRVPRRTLLADSEVPGTWFLSVQVSKTLPLDGRLSFYAFNALDRVGTYGEAGVPSNLLPGARFGLELTIPPTALFR